MINFVRQRIKKMNMERKFMLLLFILLVAAGKSSAQDLLTYRTIKSDTILNEVDRKVPLYEFSAYSRSSELERISVEMAGNHPLGDMIARKFYLLKEYYTKEDHPFPGNPAVKVVISKPVIYESVMKIDRDIRKSVKKGELSSSDAIVIMNKVLDVAINIQSSDTRAFEKSLESCTGYKSRIDFFMNGVILKY